MITFLTILAGIAFGYFIYRRIQKNRLQRDARDLGVSGRNEPGRTEQH